MSAVERRAAQRLGHKFHDAAIGRLAYLAAELDAQMAVPTVTQLQPNAGVPGGGTTVTVQGTGFLGGSTVKFGTTPAASVTFVSASQLKVVTPSGLNGTTQDVTVTTTGGTSTTSTNDQYTFVKPLCADPSATVATQLLADFFANLSSGQPGFVTGGGANLHVVNQGLNAQNLFDALLNGGSATQEFDQWFLTTGKTPAMMQVAIDYSSDVTALSNMTPQGVCEVNWSVFLAALEAHAANGGLVGVQNSIRQVPTQYQATSAYTGATMLASAITSLGGSTTGFPNSAQNGKVLGDDGALHEFTYNGITAGVSVNNVVINAPPGVHVANGAAFYLAQLVPAKSNFMSAADSAGAWCLQYDPTAYEKIPGAGANLLPGCGWTGGAHTATVTVTPITVANCTTINTSPSVTTLGNFITSGVQAGQPISGTGIPIGATVLSVNSATSLTLSQNANASGVVTLTFSPQTSLMPVVKGMYVSGTGVPAGATVSAVNANGTQLTLTATTNFTTEAGQILTFTLGTVADYAAALALDANANLNAMLDQVVVGLYALAQKGISVVFRHLNEANSPGANWFHFEGPGNCYWWAYLFAYCFKYITDAPGMGFAGQPVSATPCHNLYFVHAPIANASNADVILNPPIINGVRYCDSIGIDQYANDPSSFGANTNAMALLPASNPSPPVAGLGALGRVFAEVFGGGVLSPDPFPQSYVAAASAGVDLSTLGGGGVLSLQLGQDIPAFYAQLVSLFVGTNGGGTGVIHVPTSKGTFAVTIDPTTSVTPTSIAFPVVISSVSGVPSGAIITTKGLVTQTVAITADNCGTTTFLTDTAGRNAMYMTWWGCFNQMHADLAGMTTIMTDTSRITLQNLSTYFTVPWAFRTATNSCATADAATRLGAFARSGANANVTANTGARQVSVTRTGPNACATVNSSSRSVALSRTGPNACATVNAAPHQASFARTGANANATVNSGQAVSSVHVTGTNACATVNAGHRTVALHVTGTNAYLTDDLATRHGAPAGVNTCLTANVATRGVALPRTGSNANLTANGALVMSDFARTGTNTCATVNSVAGHPATMRTGVNTCLTANSATVSTRAGHFYAVAFGQTLDVWRFGHTQDVWRFGRAVESGVV